MCSLPKAPFMVRHQIVTDYVINENLLHCFQHMMENKITILEILLNTENLSSIKLPTQGIMYHQICFRQDILYITLPFLRLG